MTDDRLRLFISYSRVDSAFVDRLEADLRARGFDTWVDRRKLEGGQDWLDEIQQAIDACAMLLVVLSPEAVESEWVRTEYRYAKDTLKKHVIPLDYRHVNRVPMDLNLLQWVNFQVGYDQGLNALLIAVNRIEMLIDASGQTQKAHTPNTITRALVQEPNLVTPAPAPPPPAPALNDLYKQGVQALAQGDLERTAALWEAVLRTAPDFGNGTLQLQHQQLLRELLPKRIERLRAQANDANQKGEWGQEIGAWQALQAMVPDEAQTTDRADLARHNQKYAWLYQNAQAFVAAKDKPAARAQLQMLWRDAPYYGDPDNLARVVGLPGRKPATDVLAEERQAASRKATSALRSSHIHQVLKVSPQFVYALVILLVACSGGLFGELTQSWLVAIAATTSIAALAYGLVYRYLFPVYAMLGLWVVSVLAAIAIASLGMTSDFSVRHRYMLWTGGTSTISPQLQVLFGCFASIVTWQFGHMFLRQQGRDSSGFLENFPLRLLAMAGLVLVIGIVWWLEVELFLVHGQWGVGVGYGWQYGVFDGLLVNSAAGLGLYAALFILLSLPDTMRTPDKFTRWLKQRWF